MAAKVPDLDELVQRLHDLPLGKRGEIIEGVLYVHPRPRLLHMDIEDKVGADIKNPYQRGRGGPGGWWIISEPGIELPRSPEFSPDVAGWLRERMPTLPEGRVTLAPDWICEILSPSTRGYDQRVKRPFYAKIGVGWLWYVDLDARTLTVSKLESGKWLELDIFGEADRVRAEPFPEAELDLAEWWGETEPPSAAI